MSKEKEIKETNVGTTTDVVETTEVKVEETAPVEETEKKGFMYKAGYAAGKVWNSKPMKVTRKVAKAGALLGVGFVGGYAAGKGEVPFVHKDNSTGFDGSTIDSTAGDFKDISSDET